MQLIVDLLQSLIFDTLEYVSYSGNITIQLANHLFTWKQYKTLILFVCFA